MTTSDSEDFESADEGGSLELTDKKNFANRTPVADVSKDTSPNVKSQTLVPHDNQDSTKKSNALTLNEDPKNDVHIDSSNTDGWDDFDIDEVPNVKSNTSSGGKIQTKTNQSDVQSKTDGWGDFDDWGAGEQKSKAEVIVSAPSTVFRDDQELRSVADRLSAVGEKHGIDQDNSAWGWGGWVSTISNHVSQGISTVTNALESSIGAPDPEEMARKLQEDRLMHEVSHEELKEHAADGTSGESPIDDALKKDDANVFGFGQIMSSVSQITKLVETTGTKVLHGGLDTLENIGKKTMQVLQDGDPGLAKKKAMFGLDGGAKPVLSHILREAKERAEEEDRQRAQKKQAKEVHYETLFDDFAGLVHLEALEMLSKQSDMKIQSLLMSTEGEQLEELKETLSQVKELCELPEEDDEDDDDPGNSEAGAISETFRSKLVKATQDIGVKTNLDPIVSLWRENLEWLLPQIRNETPDLQQTREVFRRAISCLAHTTALSVEMYHKTAEMMLVKNRRSTADEADGLTQLTTVLTHHISSVATLFTRLLGQLAVAGGDADSSITNIFLEAGNSSSYIRDAFHLTLPILQCGAT